MTELPHPLCRNFDSKKLMMAGRRVDGLEDKLQNPTWDQFWCTRTWSDTGPDGGWVLYDRCAPGRECYCGTTEQEAGTDE